jgi:hypothetical protein
VADATAGAAAGVSAGWATWPRTNTSGAGMGTGTGPDDDRGCPTAPLAESNYSVTEASRLHASLSGPIYSDTACGV